ncbi:MAG: hypothetical protein HY314_01185 [Acidobacteria bacterium]|nr:hypothetical protein [Acidobacteriota bacterium]
MLDKSQGEAQSSFVEVDLFDASDVAKFSDFALWGQHHAMGIRMLSPGGRDNVMYAMGSNGPKVIDIVKPGRAIGFLPAGVPHHLTGDFGWWHVNSTDEIYIPVTLADGRIAFVILEAQMPDRIDKFQWYCQSCHHRLFEREVETGKVGIDGYWKAERAAIEQFNRDERLRSCSQCGAVHPLAYSFFAHESEKNW